MSEVILKKQRNWQLMALLVVVVLIASGCVSYDANGQPYGAVYEYLGKPAAAFLDFLAGFLFNSYGLAIIIVTLLTRVFMLPSSLKMTRDTMISQARMKVAQPEINEIQEEINASKDPAERARLQQELMGVYKKYNINMLATALTNASHLSRLCCDSDFDSYSELYLLRYPVRATFNPYCDSGGCCVDSSKLAHAKTNAKHTR